MSLPVEVLGHHRAVTDALLRYLYPPSIADQVPASLLLASFKETMRVLGEAYVRGQESVTAYPETVAGRATGEGSKPSPALLVMNPEQIEQLRASPDWKPIEAWPADKFLAHDFSKEPAPLAPTQERRVSIGGLLRENGLWLAPRTRSLPRPEWARPLPPDNLGSAWWKVDGVIEDIVDGIEVIDIATGKLEGFQSLVGNPVRCREGMTLYGQVRMGTSRLEPH